MRCGLVSGTSAVRPVAPRFSRCAQACAATRSVHFTVASEDEAELRSSIVQPGAAQARERFADTSKLAPRTAAAALSLEDGEEPNIAALEARLFGNGVQRPSQTQSASAKRDKKRSSQSSRAQFERGYTGELQKAEKQQDIVTGVPARPQAKRRKRQPVPAIASIRNTQRIAEMFPQHDVVGIGTPIWDFLDGLEKELPASYVAYEAGERILTRDEERCLVLRISHGRPPYSSNGHKKCSHGEIEALAIKHSVSIPQALRIAKHAHWARKLLMRYHWRFVHSIAHKYKSKRVDHNDLFYEGLQGLKKAVDNYQLGGRAKFSTYAYPYISRSMRELLARSTSSCEPSQYDLQLLNKVRDARRRIASGQKGYGIVFSDPKRVPLANVAREAGISLQLARRVERSAFKEVSPDTPLFMGDDEAGETLGDTLATYSADLEFDENGKQHKAIQALDIAKVRGCFATVLQTLDPRERNIVRLRFGLNKEGAQVPRSRIAEAYGISVQAVTTLERQALKKLKAPWRRAYLQRTCGDLLHPPPERGDVNDVLAVKNVSA